MTDPERTKVAEALLTVIFSMRADNGPAGQAWTLSIATTAMSRAILASIGPTGDAEALVKVAFDQVMATIAETQSRFIRGQLTRPGSVQ